MTYSQAAENAYFGLLTKWDNMNGVKGAPDSFWITANTFNAFLDYWICIGQLRDPNIPLPNITPIITPIISYFDETATEDNGTIWLDDYGWWGNAFLTAWENADVLKLSDAEGTYKQRTINCWTIMKNGWDTGEPPPVPVADVPGGVWNCRDGSSLTGRNTVTNSVFWLMSVRLKALTGDSQYVDPNNSLQWFQNGFAKGLLFDKTKDDKNIYTVRERFIGEHDWDTAPKGFYWAGDQGLFLRCLFEEKRPMQPDFEQLKTEIVDAVLSNMVDGENVIHDHPMPGFENDYATGKGVFIRHALRIFPLTTDPKRKSCIKSCIMGSANFAWNTSKEEPDFHHYFQFCWNPQGKLPPDTGDWDTASEGPASPIRGVILQASGLDAITAAAALSPGGVIPN